MACRRTLSAGFSITGLSIAAIAVGVALPSPVQAARPPRAERIAGRRLERIEAIERRAEASAEMPPKPSEVRRMLRRGEQLPDSAKRGDARATAAATPPGRVPAPSTAAGGAAPPRPFVQPPVVAPAPQPSGEPPAPVSQATAIDDGTRSVLVRDKPIPAPPAEVLPTPASR
jgi:hypothetical protein